MIQAFLFHGRILKKDIIGYQIIQRASKIGLMKLTQFLMYAPKYAEYGIFERASDEELPNEVRHSSLQKVIQLLN